MFQNLQLPGRYTYQSTLYLGVQGLYLVGNPYPPSSQKWYFSSSRVVFNFYCALFAFILPYFVDIYLAFLLPIPSFSFPFLQFSFTFSPFIFPFLIFSLKWHRLISPSGRFISPMYRLLSRTWHLILEKTLLIAFYNFNPLLSFCVCSWDHYSKKNFYITNARTVIGSHWALF